ncbi:MAG: Tim44/TimA family putative adaptor protein, partial [Paracoccaceae bacterium]|nr:Tim44/TimA family putative adaptor protein [Paracoccaceae bacterium]
YEMILMAFEHGEMEKIASFLAPEVLESFTAAVDAREAQGLTVEAKFLGLRDMALHDATFNHDTREAEVAVRFTGELHSVVRNKLGEVVEGSPTEIKRQRDVWTFARVMGSDDPNWRLVATGD